MSQVSILKSGSQVVESERYTSAEVGGSRALKNAGAIRGNKGGYERNSVN
jgi:hypothetical protein